MEILKVQVKFTNPRTGTLLTGIAHYVVGSNTQIVKVTDVTDLGEDNSHLWFQKNRFVFFGENWDNHLWIFKDRIQ